MADLPPVRFEGAAAKFFADDRDRALRILSKWGATWISSTQRGFRDQKRGHFAWAPRRVPNLPGMLSDFERGPRVKPRRFDERPALIDTGMLRQSHAWKRRSADSILVGTAVDYADLHQQGGTSTVIVTSTMKRNLWTWMKSEAGKRARWRAGDRPGKSEFAWRKKRHRARLREETKFERRDLSAEFGWIFGKKQIEFKIKARPHVVFTDEDKADLQRIARAEYGSD